MIRIQPSAVELADLELLSVGGYWPVKTFVGKKDYWSILEKMRLSSGEIFSIPPTLAVSTELARKIKPETKIEISQGRKLLARLIVKEKFWRDYQQEAKKVFGTTDQNHPGVKNLSQEKPVCLSGVLQPVSRPEKPAWLKKYSWTPEATKKEFRRRGWKSVVGFQTRNPVHRAHEYLQKCALEIVDGLLLNPIVGLTKSDDIPHEVRFKCYEVLLDNYYPKDRVLLVANPLAMRYAGPREAILHALVRRNYGCTHFIVGRDHAGVGNYYGPYDAQKIFDRLGEAELGIKILKFEDAFYCQKCQAMATRKTCPHPPENHLHLSGTRLRQLLRENKLPPGELSRPEVAEILSRWWQSLDNCQGN